MSHDDVGCRLRTSRITSGATCDLRYKLDRSRLHRNIVLCPNNQQLQIRWDQSTFALLSWERDFLAQQACLQDLSCQPKSSTALATIRKTVSAVHSSKISNVTLSISGLLQALRFQSGPSILRLSCHF